MFLRSWAWERVRWKARDKYDVASSPLVTVVQEHRRRVIATAASHTNMMGDGLAIADGPTIGDDQAPMVLTLDGASVRMDTSCRNRTVCTYGPRFDR
ncbi:hypothetical protein FB595_111108 [Sphingobium sp. AEW010]|nr:hypothetical protein [Sphingobium sp. JAI105]TWD04827.1 hypothetical protein FB595_111108 [Sphingobium sp. AEW010]TWD22235.1 hypothetical protein FB596_111108 [Sphingobium sp. AEW013]TWD24724.1 hypothetical protein FB594_111108 [Sphingobium sp. AEW001]